METKAEYILNKVTDMLIFYYEGATNEITYFFVSLPMIYAMFLQNRVWLWNTIDRLALNFTISSMAMLQTSLF